MISDNPTRLLRTLLITTLILGVALPGTALADPVSDTLDDISSPTGACGLIFAEWICRTGGTAVYRANCIVFGVC